MTSSRNLRRHWIWVLFFMLMIPAYWRWDDAKTSWFQLTEKSPPPRLSTLPPYGAFPESTPPKQLEHFFDFVSGDLAAQDQAAPLIEASWDDSHAVFLLELAQVHGMTPQIHDVLTRNTNQKHTQNMDWWQWVCSEDLAMPPGYADFKAAVYSVSDFRFHYYFDGNPNSTIRLNEIRWGSVKRDEIPRLESPEKFTAADVEYLEEDNIIFGVEINGEAVAYPRRILVWHEIIRDVVGGESVSAVYSPLCGSMIVYRTTRDGVEHDLGTSGFLYRSDKLMYDKATLSLWSSLKGEPVVGPLVGQGIRLETLPVVTTTWGAWRQRHPETTVLSLNTGHNRDYSDGAVYQDYFSTDEIWFPVPARDERLRNKDEVFAIRHLNFPDDSLAISTDFLSMHPVYQTRIGSMNLVVLTDTSGTSRAYETRDEQFAEWDGENIIRNNNNVKWEVTEAALVPEDSGEQLNRLPAHRAFWFAWNSMYPETQLVQ